MPDPNRCTSATGCPSVSDDTKTGGLIVVGLYLCDDEAHERSAGTANVDHDADEQAVLVPRTVIADWADSQRTDQLLADSEAQGQAQRDRVMLAAVRAYADELYSAPWKVDACGVRERPLGILTPPGPSITFEEALAASSLGTPGVQAVTP